MRTVIAFDVSRNRIRYRVVKVLKEHAVRVQKSVFEAPDMGRAAYLRMRSRLERLIDSGAAVPSVTTVTHPPSARQLRRARTATAALFFTNGALFANLLPRCRRSRRTSSSPTPSSASPSPGSRSAQWSPGSPPGC